MFYGNKTAIMLAKYSSKTPLLILKGQEGLGKSLVAKAIIRKSMCLGNFLKDCSCSSCSKLKSNNHPDFFYVSLKRDEKNIKLDDIAFISKELLSSPLLSKQKVFMIDDANCLTEAAQNRLLKTLEDAPEHTKFVLVTHGELLGTILSRGIVISFSPLDPMEMHEFIKTKTDDKVLQEIISASAGGSPGRAITLLDNEEYFLYISDTFNVLLNDGSVETLLDSVGLLKEKDARNILTLLDTSIYSYLICLYSFFSDLLKSKLGSIAYFTSYADLLYITSQSYDLKHINKALEEIQNCVEKSMYKTLTDKFFAYV